MMLRRLTHIVAAMLAVTVPVVALAAITPGTQLIWTIDKGFSSKDAHVGETFTLSDVHSSNHDINGAVVYGHVAKVQKQPRKRQHPAGFAGYGEVAKTLNQTRQ